MPGPRLTLLLAEDDPNDQLLFTLAMGKVKSEIEIQTVRDGEQLIDYLEGNPPFDDRQEHPFPSLLLVDLKMPRRDGFSVLEWLFWRPSLRPQFVMVFSASGRSEDMQRAKRLGADSYIVKPQDPASLLRLVRGLDAHSADAARACFAADL